MRMGIADERRRDEFCVLCLAPGAGRHPQMECRRAHFAAIVFIESASLEAVVEDLLADTV